MTTPTTTEADTTTRWISRVALALLVAGLVAMTSLGGAGAAPFTDGSATAEDSCAKDGGQWIEVFYPSGALESQGCYFPDGSGYECGTLLGVPTCTHFSVGPTSPPTKVPGSGDSVGGDLGPSADSAADAGDVDDDEPKQPKKRKKGHGRGRHHR